MIKYKSGCSLTTTLLWPEGAEPMTEAQLLQLSVPDIIWKRPLVQWISCDEIGQPSNSTSRPCTPPIFYLENGGSIQIIDYWSSNSQLPPRAYKFFQRVIVRDTPPPESWVRNAHLIETKNSDIFDRVEVFNLLAFIGACGGINYKRTLHGYSFFPHTGLAGMATTDD